MRPKVTVAIASYNNGNYINRCANSVIDQTYQNLEILIVDDGSTDDTLERCHIYEKDSRVKLLSKKNGGLSSSRQQALELANGDYICFIDADDYLKKNHVESLLKKIEDDGSDVCISSTLFVDEQLSPIKALSLPFEYDDSKDVISIQEDDLIDNYIDIIYKLSLSDSWNKMYKTSFLKKTGVRFELPKGFNGTDSVFNKKLVLHKPRYSTISNEGYVHVIYKSSAVHRKNKLFLEGFSIIEDQLINECKKLGINTRMGRQLSILYANFVRTSFQDVYAEAKGLLPLYRTMFEMGNLVRSFYISHDDLSIDVKDMPEKGLKVFVSLFKYGFILLPCYFFVRNFFLSRS